MDHETKKEPTVKRKKIKHENVEVVKHHAITILAIMATGGGGYLTKFNTGRLRPEVQPHTILYTILAEKAPTFIYLLLRNGTPFAYLL